MAPVRFDEAARLTALIESTHDLIWSVDLDYRLVTFNTAFASHWKNSLGVAAARGMPPLDIPEPGYWGSLYGRALREGPYRTEYVMRDARWMELSFNPIVVDGLTAGVSVFGKDITERKLAQELRNNSERRFRTLIEDAPTAVGISRNGICLYANAKYVAMFGFANPGQLIGQPIGLHWAVECRELIEERSRQRMLGIPLPTEYESMGLRTDGTTFPVHVSVTRVELTDGPATVAFLTDITERKLAEEARRSSEARFRSYFDLPLVGMAMSSPEKGVTAANDRICEILGYTREELIGKNWADLTHPDDLVADVEQFERLLAGEIKTYSTEKRFIRKDGREIWTALSAGCVRKPDGTVDYVCANMRDISDRKRAQDGLRASEARFRALFEKAPMAIGLSRNGRILSVNPKYLETFGLSNAEQVIGTPVVERWAPESRATIETILESHHSSGPGSVVAFEGVAQRADGSRFPAQLQATGVDLPDGPSGIAFLTDISERKRAEQALQASLEQTIRLISETVEQRDPYTAGHQRRVAELCGRIAEKLVLDPFRIQGLQLAATIHDLGKIAIPAEILAKPGLLTPIQFNLIREHAQLGYEIVKTVSFPWPIADVIHQHHERLDGSGYPQGLRANEILLEARILAVADVVEAMASHRPYRATRGLEAALAEVIEQRGKLYDADAVEACVTVFQKDGYVFPA